MQNKNYKYRSFVIDNKVLDKLQKYADSQKRSLNYIVAEILKEFCEKI